MSYPTTKEEYGGSVSMGMNGRLACHAEYPGKVVQLVKI
jgi:hypothetical protein